MRAPPLVLLLLPCAVACTTATAPEAATRWPDRPDHAADPSRAAPLPVQAANAPRAQKAPPGTNVHLTILGDLPAAATLTVRHLAPESLAKEGALGFGEDNVVLKVPIAAVPTEHYLTLPPGAWVLMAMVASGGFADAPLAMGYACKDKALHVVAIAPGQAMVLEATLRLQPPLPELGSPAKVCADEFALGAKGLFTEVTAVTTPPTKAGSAHFMAGHVWQDRLWIAGSQDGYVSFDFPSQPAAGQMQNWTVWGDNTCNHLERVGSTIFCASRNGFVLALQTAPGTQQKVALHKAWISDKLCTEGLAAHGSRLYVAVHGQGLRALDTKPPYAVLPVATPPQVDDAWDLEPLDANHLALADGTGGLKILSVAGNKAAEPSVIAHLPLPGRAAFLHRQQGRLVIGALGGGLHLVDVSQPAAPKLQGTLALPGAVYGVTVHLDTIFAAAGHHLVAVDLPPPDVNGPMKPRAALASRYFALDVDPFGDGLLAAEFRQVRRLDLNLQFSAGPVMLAPVAVYGRVAAQGGTLATTLRLHNAGTAPLEVKNLRVVDTGSQQSVPGQWTVVPGHTAAIPVAVTKLGKGAADHTLRWTTNDPAQPEAKAVFGETTWLQPGDALPAGLQWHDAGGKNWVVADHFKGKVGVLLIAAESCPVAFMALAAAAQDLQPWLAGGKAGAQVAVLGVNPWDKPGVNPETQVLSLPFPMLYSGLTSKDGHDWSDVLDVTLGQPIPWGPPMPIAYVVGVDGVIRHAAWGWDSGLIQEAIQLAVP